MAEVTEATTEYHCDKGHPIVRTIRPPKLNMTGVKCECNKMFSPFSLHYGCIECQTFLCLSCGDKKFSPRIPKCFKGHDLLVKESHPLADRIKCSLKPGHILDAKKPFYVCPSCQDFNRCINS